MVKDFARGVRDPSLAGYHPPCGCSGSAPEYFVSTKRLLADTLKRCQPEVVALNCCAAETVENGRLIMDAEDVHCVAKTAPNARLYLTHLDNVAHAALTRHTLKGKLAERGVTNYDIPNDGQSVMY